MPISVRLNSKDELLIKKYAKMHNISISELVRDSVIARIEDEIDLAAYDKAMAEYRKDPTTYSHEEIKKMLG
jgi:hypothetical protein